MWAPDATILNGVDLNIESVLGLDSSAITRAIQFTTEETLIYTSGPHIVMQDISTGKFICQPREETDSQVTLLKVYHDSEGSKTILGEAFTSNFPTLSYQDSEQSHMLIHRHLPPSDHLIEVALSKDSTICYTLSHMFISAWILKSQRLISYAKVPPGIRKIEAMPSDENKVILGGFGYLKYWTLCSERKAIEEDEKILYTGDVLEMQYIPGSAVLLVLCAEGKLLMLEDYKYKTMTLRFQATSMAVNAQECLFGCNNEVDLYTIDKANQLQILHIFKLQIKTGVVSCIAYSPDDCTAVVLVKCDSTLEVFLVETSDCTITRPFGISLNTGGIKGISVSTGKELVCSYGLDRTVRVWNYSKHCKGIAEQHFAENPCIAAIHPTGYQIAVGFENSFKVFYLLYESLSLAFSLGKRCEAIAYSACGRFLAFGQNNNISVYDPYTLTILYALQGHTGVPQQLSWREELRTTGGEKLLTSVCLHGTVHVWRGNEKILDFSSKDFPVRQAAYDKNLDLLACIHSDGDFRVWNDNGIVQVYAAGEKDFTSVMLCSDLDIVVLGMRTGIIRIILWPIVQPSESGTDPEWSEWSVHVGPVSYLNIAYSTIFTAGADSMIVCLAVKQVKEGRAKQPVYTKELEALNNLSLIPQPSLDLQIEKIEQLNDSIKTLETDSFELEQQEKKYEERINDLKNSVERDANRSTEEYNAIVEQMRAKEKEFIACKAEKNTIYTNKIMLQNDRFNKMLNDEFENYEKLKEEMEISTGRFSRQKDEIMTVHQEIIEQCELDYKARLGKIMEVFNELQKKVQNEKKKYEAIIVQTDFDFEDNIKVKLNQQKDEIEEERKKAREYLGKHAKLIRDNTTVQKELQQMKEKSMEYKEENKNLSIEKNNIKEKLQDLDNEMKKREEIIKKRENKIKDLRSLHIHLQNYRFVLDQKISSLKDERAPMEEQNKQIQEHIKKLFNELLEESSTQNATYKLLLSFKQKNSEALATNNHLREELLSSHNSLNVLYSDLSVLLEEKDKHLLVEKLRELYYKHVGKEDIFPSETPTKPTLNEIFLKEKQENIDRIKHEKDQQEHFMQVMYKSMNANKISLEEEHSKQVLLKQKENAMLIKECYELRQDKEQLTKNISDLEAEIKRLKYALKGGVIPDQRIRASIIKDTPFQEYMKKKLVPPQEIYQPRNKPDFRIRSLIFELEKNRTEYAKQNRKFNEILN